MSLSASQVDPGASNRTRWQRLRKIPHADAGRLARGRRSGRRWSLGRRRGLGPLPLLAFLCGPLGAFRTAFCGGARTRRCLGYSSLEPDQAMAKDGVVDREHVAKLVEQLGFGLELEEVVIGLRAVIDLERQLPHTPVHVAGETPLAGVDLALHLLHDRVAALVGNVGIDQDHEVVCAWLCHRTTAHYIGPASRDT